MEESPVASASVLSSQSKNFSPSTSCTPPPPSSPDALFVMRLWRPAAQRNLRNQWSNLASLRRKWRDVSSAARQHATSIVNAYLSQRYMDTMNLGVLSDMPRIRKKACAKLLKQQLLSRDKLTSSYEDMVTTVTHMVNSCKSMRCFLKGSTNSSVVQFLNSSENENDAGDGGGLPVFKFHSIASFEELAKEFLKMFISELSLKRLLVLKFLSLSCVEVSQSKELCWPKEIFPGEFGSLSICNLHSREVSEPLLPTWKRQRFNKCFLQFNSESNRDAYEVLLTTWLSEVNIDHGRLDSILSIVGEEMRINLL